MSKTRYHNTIELDDVGTDSTVEEWVALLKDGRYALKIPPLGEHYVEPYYAWWDDDERKIIVNRGHTTPSKHTESDPYIETLFSTYSPLVVEKDASSVIGV